MSTLCILGRQPALGIAELENIFRPENVQKLGSGTALLTVEPEQITISRLGGTMKVCRLLGYINASDLVSIMNHVSSALPSHIGLFSGGKLTLGFSLYGFPIGPSKINASALSVKKALKSPTRGVRIVPNKQPELNTAQVIHNQLTGKNGIEIVLVKIGKRTAFAQTVAVQDIDAYAARDQARPARDARVGMLPPKLAQIIVNLAVGNHETADSTSPCVILDPFCGTGVVLQEALLMGYKTFGSDIEPRMIEYSHKNLTWLSQTHGIDLANFSLTAADATTVAIPKGTSAIACETYLGRPLSALPAPNKLNEIIRDVDTIHKKFLQNAARQTTSGFRICAAVPAWRVHNNFKHLPVLDHLADMGYNRISFVHAETSDLIYHRPEQLVARELVILERK